MDAVTMQSTHSRKAAPCELEMGRQGFGLRFPFRVCIALVCVSCSSATTPAIEPQSFSSDKLQWAPCPADLPVEPGGDCALVEVPRRWDKDRGFINVWVRRFLPAGTARGQLWMLDGGPGSAGATFASKPWFELANEAGVELLIPMHRGVDRSTRLTCPEQEAAASDEGVKVSPAEEPACGDALLKQWGDDLAAFTAYEAAKDVVHLIEKAGHHKLPIFVFGASYGTVWAQRVLELQPAGLAGVILEGAVPPNQNFEGLSQNVDEGVQRLLGRCEEESECARHFARSPLDVARGLLQGLRDGSACGGGELLRAEELQSMLAVCLVGNPRYRRILAPLLARVSRCNASDVEELTFAKSLLLAEPEPIRDPKGTLYDPRLWNHVLATQIIQADLLRVEHSRTELVAIEEGLVATTGTSLAFFDTAQNWPHPPYPRREMRAVPSTTPVLLFAGELDGQTPLSWSERARDAHASVQFVKVRDAGHMTYAYAWTRTGANCSRDIFSQFLRAPEKVLDTSCLEAVVGLDYAGTSDDAKAVAKEVFGADAGVWPRGAN